MKLLSIFIIATCNLFVAFSLQAQPQMCGIGADVVITHWTQGDHLQIVGVASNSPAAQAGLAANQFILAVNGMPTTGLTLADCVRHIQGKPGTRVILKIGDWQHGWTNSITITRKFIPGDPLSINYKSYEIPQSLERKALSATTNQIIQVLSTNGTITVIQFTHFGITNANYRWRSRSANGTIVKSGHGRVFENYKWHVNAYGEYELTYQGNRDNLYVKAGKVRLEWSVGGPLYAWIYYRPSPEKVRILNSADFDSGSVWLKSSQ